MQRPLRSIKKRHPFPASDRAYWARVREAAGWLESDGCTGVPDFYRDACLEHDVHYRVHHTIFGEPISRREADWRLRLAIEDRSMLGSFSPMALWRWAGVRWLAGTAWKSTTSHERFKKPGGTSPSS